VRAIVIVLALSVCLGQEITAEKLIEAGHWKRARVLVERRLREAPEDPNATFLASQIRNAFGDQDAPLQLAEKAVRLDTGVARYHRQLAEVQGVMAQRAGMLQQFMLARRFRSEIDAALRLDPRDTQALRDLLEFFLLAPGVVGGDAKKAAPVAERIAAIDAAEGFLAQARIAEFHKDHARTEEMLRRAAEVRPASYKALAALGKYLSAERREDAAVEDAGKGAVALDPGRIEGYSILAEVYARRGDWTALEATFAAAAKAVPDDAAPYYRAAEVLIAEQREPGRAERYLEIYLALEPEGNQPTVADAARELKKARNAKVGQPSNAVSSGGVR
jgi:tetratricopeptide (TPR) repeat protein